MQAHPTADTLLTGNETKKLHLNTFEDIECVNCLRPHFFGQPLYEVYKKQLKELSLLISSIY